MCVAVPRRGEGWRAEVCRSLQRDHSSHKLPQAPSFNHMITQLQGNDQMPKPTESWKVSRIYSNVCHANNSTKKNKNKTKPSPFLETKLQQESDKEHWFARISSPAGTSQYANFTALTSNVADSRTRSTSRFQKPAKSIRGVDFKASTSVLWKLAKRLNCTFRSEKHWPYLDSHVTLRLLWLKKTTLILRVCGTALLT